MRCNQPIISCNTVSTSSGSGGGGITGPCTGFTGAKCILYSGSTLPCSGIVFNDSLDVALQKLDTKICTLSDSQNVFSAAASGFIQLLIGDPSSIMTEGEDQLVVTEPSIAQDSVWVSFGGSELPRGVTSQKSYGVVYSPSGFTVNFLEPVANGDLYIVHYLFNQVSAYNLEFKKIQFKTGTSGSLITIGGSTLTIADDSIIPASLQVVVGGVPIPDNTSGVYNSELNYIPTFNGSSTLLTFSDPAVSDQNYLINYAKLVIGTVYTP
jgi:hypothetical protein